MKIRITIEIDGELMDIYELERTQRELKAIRDSIVAPSEWPTEEEIDGD